MDAFLKDIGFAVRSLRKSPGFALTAIVTLALGIGASTAIFSVVNAVLLRPLPYADAGQLVVVWGELRARSLHHFPFSPPNLQDIRDKAPAFQELAGVWPARADLSVDGGTPEQIRIVGATTNILSVLGKNAIAGRGFTAADAPTPPPPPPPGAQPQQPPGPPPVQAGMLGYGFWQRRFGGDASIIGRTVDVGGNPVQIIGVTEPGLEILMRPEANIDAVPDLIVTPGVDWVNAPRINVFMRVIGRLKPGATIAQAQREVDRVAADLRGMHPIYETANTQYHVKSMHGDVVERVRPAITALMGAVLFVLLIACANVANLLLVRATARERELAVRSALGGSGARIVRQLMSESLVLALSGAALGLAFASAGVSLLVALAPPTLPRLDAIGIDPVVLGFATLAAVVAAVLFGTLPAVRASRPDLANVLRASGRNPSLGGGSLLRKGVVMTEVALAFVLLIGSGLMVRSFIALANAHPGFHAEGLLTLNVGGRGGLSAQERETFMRQMRERLGALPGVQSATATFPLPLDGGLINSRWGPPEAEQDPSKFQQANLRVVLPGYFETMGTRLIAGRVFTEADNRPEPLQIMIDNVLAAKAFPGESPVGKRLFARIRGQEAEWHEVVGVVEHQRHESLAAEGRETIFVADGFFNHGFAARWVLRVACPEGTRCEPARLANDVRRVVAEVDPRRSVADLMPMTEWVARARAQTKFALVLIAVFAGIALVLTCIGLYGVLSTAVRQRTAEIGVRMAFGAPERSIFGLVIGEGLRLSAIGVGAGLVGAYMLTRVMATMLVGVTPTDPVTYATILALFFGIAVLACWLPARRAAALDPASALRSE